MTEREQQRLVKHRRAVLDHAEEVTGNVAQTCRYYGISRQTFYKWLNRYQEKGLEGLRDRSVQLTVVAYTGPLVRDLSCCEFGIDVVFCLNRSYGVCPSRPPWGRLKL